MLRPNIKSKKEKVSPFKKIYALEEFHYLDSEEALPLFEKQCDIINENDYKSIIDVGSRIGRINDILYQRGYTDYLYMGFDTSPEPIEYAKQKWSNNKNIEYRVADWCDSKSIQVDFDVDCVIFSGVLLYQPNNHEELFHRLCVDIYNTEGAIIQDLRSDQLYTDDRIQVKYIDDDFKMYEEKYASIKKYDVDCNFFYGNRIILDVKIYGG